MMQKLLIQLEDVEVEKMTFNNIRSDDKKEYKIPKTGVNDSIQEQIKDSRLKNYILQQSILVDVSETAEKELFL